MAFILIKSRLKLTVGIQDGFSVRFQANNPALWKKMNGTPIRLDTSDKSESIVQAPSLEDIEAINTTTSKTNWFQTPFLSLTKSLFSRYECHEGEQCQY